MTTTYAAEIEREWDNETHGSPFSTVHDHTDESYCEGCDSEVTYSGPNDKYGTCKCDL